MGVATHKVLMCQPYDIYCLGGGGKATFLYPPTRPSPTTFIIAASVNLPRVGNKWQTKAGGVMGDVGVAMGEWGKQLFMHAYRTLEADPPSTPETTTVGACFCLAFYLIYI